MIAHKYLLGIVSLSMLLFANEADGAPMKKDRFYYEKKGEMIWEVQTKQKVMALTFDDGPDPVQTLEILDLLKQYDAKCTFFVVGKRVKQYPDIMKRVSAEGHEIANHTYSHAYFRIPSSGRQVREEIERTENEIFKLIGRKSVLFRPPGGVYDDTIVKVSNQMGLVPIMWSWHQDTRDWSRPGVQRIRNKVLENARNGDIVLFHDHVQGKTQTTAALKVILPELKARGYRFITVSELMKCSITETDKQHPPQKYS
ncbi:polysaccharide deacetylase family protein [Paenibacillus nasutitermitis]|uniref:Polysaccharide deacetylase family sporulation protein PdaB n=1 Tax=Paenibacillus nasutitermitis TaxID=1652958 RepID=A0A916Z5V8_9BACL|nr:polysaccharide deacetylase family protein [Paenibacillus nasutitermitis]GGD75473.1 polysaccharide deacetylase family sporulation protein PdaB [Paenibacillus nasutitermitis]